VLQPGLLSRKNSLANGTQRPLPSVVLKSQAHVVGDIHHQSLTIEKAPSLMAALNKRMEQTGANPRELAEGLVERPSMLPSSKLLLASALRRSLRRAPLCR
jgi:hypothetical protein